MIIPTYWTEEKKTRRQKGRQLTFSRFGWSDKSFEDAKDVAHQRIAEAFKEYDAGEYPVKREERVAYNGSDGVPIREEVIKKCDDVIITRNPYGALCLNTPDVLFASLSLGEEHSCGISLDDTLYCWGNFMSYAPRSLLFFDGAMRAGVTPDAVQVMPLALIGINVGMPVGARLTKALGPRATTSSSRTCPTPS